MNIQYKLREIKRKSIVCTVSGGLDSAVAAALMSKANFKLHFIFFDWGQKTERKELRCARTLSRHYKADLKIVEVPLFKDISGISMVQKKVLTTKTNEYVPNRNAVLESQAIAYAEHIKAGAVCIGSSGGDVITPDNSLKFVQIMQFLVNEGTQLKPPVQIIAPLISINKADAVKLGLEIGVPFEITWSCHNNMRNACGECSNCRSRVQAFKLNNIIDPIKYAEEK